MKLSCIQNWWVQNATSELDADKQETKKELYIHNSTSQLTING